MFYNRARLHFDVAICMLLISPFTLSCREEETSRVIAGQKWLYFNVLLRSLEECRPAPSRLQTRELLSAARRTLLRRRVSFSHSVVPLRAANWLQLICPQQHLAKIKLGCVSLFAPVHLLHKQSDSAKWDDPSCTHEPPHPSSSNLRNLVTGHASAATKDGFHLRSDLSSASCKGETQQNMIIFWLASFQYLRTKLKWDAGKWQSASALKRKVTSYIMDMMLLI